MRTTQVPTVRESTAATRRLRDPEAVQERARRQTLVLDRYRLERMLGAGAFGAVWAAHDERLEREVAVKIVPRARVAHGRFEREARAAARLSHPAIVTLYEAAVDDDGAYLVSELVQGATLDQLLQAGRLSDRDIAGIAIALCDALLHAHGQGIVHRDVKPSNILVPDHPVTRAYPAKLTDFGVARVIGGDSLTRTGAVIGTAAYMAPEQAEGREAGAAADLFALALLTYEALTGVNPVRTGTAANRARRLGAHLPPLRRQRRDLPQDLGRAIDQALRPRPRERGSVEGLRRSLVDALRDLDDTPGVVDGAWSLGRDPADPHADPADPHADPADPHASPDYAAYPADPHEHLPEQPLAGAELNRQRVPWIARHRANRELEALDDPGTPGPTWPARGLAAATAAALTAWLTVHLLAHPVLQSATAATLAGLIVLALPRIGWLALTASLATAASVQHRPGAAVLFLICAVAPAVLLPRDGSAWPLPAAAALLGPIGLAGAWPAIAGQVGSRPWRRLTLGITGWLWVVLAAPIAQRALYTKIPAAGAPLRAWAPSPAATVHQVLSPIAGSGAIAAAPVWAIAALLLPFVLRPRKIAPRVVLTTIWAGVTLAATSSVLASAGNGGGGVSLQHAALGAVAAGVVALLPSLGRAVRRRPQRAGPGLELA